MLPPLLTKLHRLVPGLTPVGDIPLLPVAEAEEQLQKVTGALKTCRKALAACDHYENSCAVPPGFSDEYEHWRLMRDELVQMQKQLAVRIPKHREAVGNKNKRQK